jgi:hypothetical protein
MLSHQQYRVEWATTTWRTMAMDHSLYIVSESSSRQIDESISIADCFPPNRGVRFLFELSSRQIEEFDFYF